MYYCAIPSGVFHAPGALGHSLTQSPFLSPCFDGGGPIATLKKTKKHKQNIFFFGNALHFPGQQKSRLISETPSIHLYSPWSLYAALPAPYFNLPLPWPHWAGSRGDGTVCMARTSMSWVWLWPPLWPAAHYVEANGTAQVWMEVRELGLTWSDWNWGTWWLTITILHTLVTTRYNPRYPNEWLVTPRHS